MKIILIHFIILLPGLLSSQDSLIIETLRSNLFEVTFNDGKLEGNGVQLLEKGVQNHHFVTIGEMHGIREVGEFSEGMYRIGKKHGYKYFAIETDPWVAQKLEYLAAQPIDSLRAFEKRYPLAIPFYGNQNDFSFLAAIVQENDVEGRKIWGLDQTFVAATRFLLHEVMNLAKTEPARAIAKKHFDRSVSAFGEAMQNRDPGSVYLRKMTDDDFRELEEAFHEEKNFEAMRILAGMKESKEIYQHWYDGAYYQNNRVRSRWMKDTFMRYYNEAMFRDGDLPKVMFKFGSTHSVRGLSYTYIYDLGNLISELAESKGSQSMHIRFSALKGSAYNMLSGNQDFDNTGEIDARIIEAVGRKDAREGWILIDLRPLRNLPMKNQPEAFKTLVFGFDLYVLVPEAHPLEPFE